MILNRHTRSRNIRALDQANENIGFTAIRVANNRAYNTRQHFTVLALLHLLPPIIRDFVLQFVTHISSCRISCSHYGLCALDRLFKGARIRKSPSNKMYLTMLAFRHSELERWTAAVYTKVILLRVYGRLCVGQTSWTHEGEFEGIVSLLRRALQSVVDTHRQLGTKDKGL